MHHDDAADLLDLASDLYLINAGRRAHDLLDCASRALTWYSQTGDLRDGHDVGALLARVQEVWRIDLDALDSGCSVAVRWYALRAERWALDAEFVARGWAVPA